MTITEFLYARIAEDEIAARAASGSTVEGSIGAWRQVHGGDQWAVSDGGFEVEILVALRPGLPLPPNHLSGCWGAVAGWQDLAPDERDYIIHAAEHIARHDPARVLAECAAKRAIIAGTYWEDKERPSDAELHRTATHPAYAYETTEGQRKSWDEAEEPPEGEGWERNADRGRDGWDRFDYTEESYWRRLKPDADRKEWKQYIPTALRALASVYVDHPDYLQEWAL